MLNKPSIIIVKQWLTIAVERSQRHSPVRSYRTTLGKRGRATRKGSGLKEPIGRLESASLFKKTSESLDMTVQLA